MNSVNLPREIAEAVNFRWLGGAHHMLLEPILPAGFEQADEIVRAVLPGFLSVGQWAEITGLTDNIVVRRSYGTDLRAVNFRKSAWPDAGGNVGISIEDGTDNELLMSELQFLALAAHWLGALRDGAVESGDPATAAAWWPAWVGKVGEIERGGTRVM